MHDRSHKLDIELIRNDKRVVERTVTLNGETKEVIEPSWPGKPTEYELTVEIDGDWNHTVEHGPDDSLQEGCTIIYITIAPDGVPAIGTSPSAEVSAECPK